MADENKDGTKNPSYCYSTAVSDAVLAATCVYGRLFHTITNIPFFYKIDVLRVSYFRITL